LEIEDKIRLSEDREQIPKRGQSSEKPSRWSPYSYGKKINH
jgi:hypothetical protein